MPALPRTTIAIIDKRTGPGHVAQEVRVNDVPVLVAEDGVYLDYSANELTTVTLKLLPEQITFGRDESEAGA